MSRKLRFLFYKLVFGAILIPLAVLLVLGPKSHHGNIHYLLWKYGLGPYSEDVVTKLIRFDRGFTETIVGKDEAWIRGRFPELHPAAENREHFRTDFHCPDAEIYQVGETCIYVGMKDSKGIGIGWWSGPA